MNIIPIIFTVLNINYVKMIVIITLCFEGAVLQVGLTVVSLNRPDFGEEPLAIYIFVVRHNLTYDLNYVNCA